MLNNNILALTSKICINAGIKLFNIFNIFAKVKFFTVIFSIYILLLSIAPCGDSIECDERNQTEKSHNDHKHENENCTPFCICACCGQPVTSKINYPAVQTVSKPDIFNKNIAINDQTFNSQFSASIWQPPKIS